MKTAGKILFFLALASALAGLLIQFPVTVSRRIETGDSHAGAILFFFSFFTILTNTFVLLVLLSRLKRLSAPLRVFNGHVATVTATVAITVVMIVYHLILAPTHEPAGIEIVANLCTHYITPVLFLFWWLVEGRTGNLTWQDLPKILVYPVLYLVFTYIRSFFAGEYPYEFLDIGKMGIAGVIPYIISIFAAFLFLGAVVILIDRNSGRNA